MLRRTLLAASFVLFAFAIPINVQAQQAAQPNTVPIGTKWRSVTNSAGGSKQQVFTLTGTSSFSGKPVYLVTDGNLTHLIDVATLNLMATMRSEKIIETSLPNNGVLSWPLFPGKTWTGTFDYVNYDDKSHFNGVSSTFRVTGFEDVTVPAGTFRALKVEGTPVNASAYRTIWYAPVPGVLVKSVYDRRGSLDYRGASMQIVTELIEYPHH
jgi:hypothetical protein